ncbi:MAG: DKNYY domain-containing protein [Prevotella sp.]|nr:DKNYY domain-containing protein [Prevotella sp.]
MMRLSKRTITLTYLWVACILSVLGQSRWNDYQKADSMVLYQGQALRDADPGSFSELGFGYGKDRFNVYYRGEVLEFVNPSTFEVDARFTRHHHIGNLSQSPRPSATIAKDSTELTTTAKDKWAKGIFSSLGMDAEVGEHYDTSGGKVTYDNHPVKGADAASFVILKAGYAKDKHHAYYCGKMITGALGGNHFDYTSDDYATDGFHTYFRGKEVTRD